MRSTYLKDRYRKQKKFKIRLNRKLILFYNLNVFLTIKIKIFDLKRLFKRNQWLGINCYWIR